MRRLDLARADSGLRARRWDAIVLGSALPGIVAATRLAQRGHRVLVVEEEAAARLPAPQRDPFFLGPSGGSGVVDACLAALRVGLRDRRRIESDGISHQVVFRDARIDVGGPERTAQELVSWGLAKPDEALQCMAGLAAAAKNELTTLLDAPLVRRAGLRGLARGRGSHPQDARTLDAVTQPAFTRPALARFIQTQIRGLAHVAGHEVPTGAMARLVGGALLGGGGFANREVTLRRLLRRRLEELHGELRTTRAFELVSLDPHPGIALPHSREVWLGRVLILNAPLGLLAEELRRAELPVPSFLDVPPPKLRRITVDLRCEPDVIPEGMARRVIRLIDGDPDTGSRVVTIARWPAAAAHEPVHLVVRMALDSPDMDVEEARRIASEAALSLMPFSSGRVNERIHPLPRWDVEDVLADASPSTPWPPDSNLRLGTRRPVFTLPREETAALGTEGDILLGWRAGDAISEELG